MHIVTTNNTRVGRQYHNILCNIIIVLHEYFRVLHNFKSVGSDCPQSNSNDVCTGKNMCVFVCMCVCARVCVCVCVCVCTGV